MDEEEHYLYFIKRQFLWGRSSWEFVMYTESTNMSKFKFMITFSIEEKADRILFGMYWGFVHLVLWDKER